MNEPKVIYSEYKPSGLREELLTYGINPATERGLEIGALNHPIIKPSNGDIKFIDYTDTDTLKLRHEAHPERVKNIVNVSYVWSGSGSLAEIVGEYHSFDYFIACHVIEHVPNILGWFRGMNEVLKHGGIINLAIPDKRFTFDVNCPLSTVGQMIEADLLSYKIPSIRQMFDNTFYAKNIKPGAIWEGEIDVNTLSSYSNHASQLAYDQALKILHFGKYYDSHCWIFTPLSFLELLKGAISLNLFSLNPIAITPTKINDFEFFATFQSAPANADKEQWKKQQLESISKLEETVKRQKWVGELLAG